ncbi:C6 transcription factor [Colletotrichum karsti]|uniref:C6 transcription factor n=1 Tax=Colletotrichum karsti TaxID=1095194 RepID=A0A9P6I6K6_9PEZI|nr:C6 transcription factor [Colletotrichum karsti]KAF9872935.1 C6 transcription factor [Colletotrichum karsti]
MTPPAMSSPSSRRPRSLWLIILLTVISLVSAASESLSEALPAQITPPAIIAPLDALIVDDRTPTMIRGRWTMLPNQELRKRDDDSVTDTPTATQKVKATDDPTTLTISVAVPATTVAAASPLPSPFDTSLAFNFTSNDGASCPRFINELLTNQNFKKCYPLSMLLQGSRSFFEAEKQLLSIVKVLDATCSADVAFCTSYLNGVAGNLTMDANCGSDYDSGNPIVMQAYLGLKSYEMLYKATCLTDPDTSMYCFANAVTNLTTPSNVYFYYLPLNMTLPGSANPTCGSCLKRTMEIYQTFTANRRLAISSTYVDAAKQVNTICGPEYVNDTLQIAVGMAGLSVPSWALTTALVALAVAFNFG